MRVITSVWRTISLFNLFLSLLPIVLLALFVLLAAWMRSTLGHWPVVYRDETTHGPALWLAMTIGRLAPALPLSIPLWALSLVGPWKWRGGVTLLTHFALYAGGIGLLILCATANPFGFAEWWFD
jgi:hypothetical protein